MIDRGAVTRVFSDEARELLIDMESLFLELEQVPNDKALVAKCFRTMHTLKGSGAMFGYVEAARVAHALENAFDRVRRGTQELSPAFLGVCLEAKDHLQALLEGDPESVAPELAAISQTLMARIAAFETAETAGRKSAASAPAEAASSAAVCEDGVEVCHWVRLFPAEDWMQRGLDPLRLLDALRRFGHLDVAPVFDGGGLEPETAAEGTRLTTRWECVLTTRQSAERLRSEFSWMLDPERLVCTPLGEASICPSPQELLRAALANGEHDGASLVAAARQNETAGACICPEGAPLSVETVQGAEGVHSSIRVDSAKLDRLVGFVGELVILQSRLSQLVRSVSDDGIREVAEGLERLAGSLRDSAMSMRMVPMGTTFHSFRRLVRDLATRLGKSVRFEAQGGDTELDKTLIDQLRDPLLHLLRNAMDHGIESAEVRKAAGKPAEGVIRLGASHSGGEVHIFVSDDGAGVDMGKVRQRAEELELVARGDDIDTHELLSLLFLPGFTTTSDVSEISGRGVGMDVVRNAITALRGTLDIETEAGGGTTCHIRLPLTLAIIDGMRVRVGDDSYILPLTMIEACLERFVTGPVRPIECLEYRDRLIPCVSLRALLGVPGEQPGYERVIVAGKEGQEVGFAVDAVVGLQQAVIKGVGDLCRNVSWISGTTVDADGGISLILDVAQLTRFATESGEKTAQAE